jgi:hypothetical protein
LTNHATVIAGCEPRSHWALSSKVKGKMEAKMETDQKAEDRSIHRASPQLTHEKGLSGSQKLIAKVDE